MGKTVRVLTATAALACAALPSLGAAQSWASWTTANVGAGTMSGFLGSSTISFSGSYNGYQLSNGTSRSGSVSASGGCGYAFFTCTPAPYSSPGVSGPTNDGFIQYTNVGRGTITFGTAVKNPLISFISVGQGGAPVRYNFLTNSFTRLSDNTNNAAAWGSGTNAVSGNIINGTEYSGTIRLDGTFNSFDFEVMDAENWHGMTVGAESVVPEPSTYALMGAGLLGVGFFSRRRRR